MKLTAGTLLIVILAIVFGLVGVYTVRTLLVQTPPPEPEPVYVTLPLSSTALPAGRVVALGDIVLKQMERENMAAMDVPRDQVMMLAEQIIGRRLRVEMSPGQAFLTANFFLEYEIPDYANLLEPGQRVFQFYLPESRGAGAVSPGTFVDVLFKANPRAATDDAPAIPEVTVVLLENVKVIDVKRPRSTEEQGAAGNVLDLRSVNQSSMATERTLMTLAVSLDQATRLKAAQDRGDLSVVARLPETQAAAAAADGLTLAQLLGIEPAEPPFTTEIYRRGSRQVLSFVDGKLLARSGGRGGYFSPSAGSLGREQSRSD